MNGVCDFPQDFSVREKLVCSIVCSSHEPIRFTDIKRESKLHQEILSRILRRNMETCHFSKVGKDYGCKTCNV